MLNAKIFTIFDKNALRQLLINILDDFQTCNFIIRNDN